MGRPINTAIILECWDEVVRLAASLKARTVAPLCHAEKARGLSAPEPSRLRGAGHRLNRASVIDPGLLERKDRRRRCLAGLNKSEARHALAAAVFTQKQGRLTDRTVESQEFRASGLNLVTAAIVYWNTLYMERAVNYLRAAGQPAPNDLLAHVAPLSWSHISLTGDYLWSEPSAAAETFLPLRLNDRLRAIA